MKSIVRCRHDVGRLRECATAVESPAVKEAAAAGSILDERDVDMRCVAERHGSVVLTPGGALVAVSNLYRTNTDASAVYTHERAYFVCAVTSAP